MPATVIGGVLVVVGAIVWIVCRRKKEREILEAREMTIERAIDEPEDVVPSHS